MASIGQVPGSALRRVADWLHVPFYSPTLNLADAWLRGGVLAAAGAWPWHHRSRPGGQPDPAGRPSPGTSHAPARGSLAESRARSRSAPSAGTCITRTQASPQCVAEAKVNPCRAQNAQNWQIWPRAPRRVTRLASRTESAVGSF